MISAISVTCAMNEWRYPPPPAHAPPPRKRMIREIAVDVCRGHGIPLSQVLSESRVRRIARVRQEIMWRSYEAGHSLPKIGRVLNRDHTTVLWGVRQYERLLSENGGDHAVEIEHYDGMKTDVQVNVRGVFTKQSWTNS